jgi:type 1 glutamine amidotransferase
MFSRSALFEHPVIRREGSQLSFAEQRVTELAGDLGCRVDCTKDGGVFDRDLDGYAAILSYSCGRPEDLMKEGGKDGSPPLTQQGWQNLDEAVRAGKPILALHPGFFLLPEAFGADAVGGAHGSQQSATMRVVSPGFPGLEGLPGSFSMFEEWFSLIGFREDLHVILAQDCTGMDTKQEADRRYYDRPPFPATWARMHGKGRVFYTTMGHREDVLTSEVFRRVFHAGLAWALGRVDFDISPNIAEVTPEASTSHMT